MSVTASLGSSKFGREGGGFVSQKKGSVVVSMAFLQHQMQPQREETASSPQDPEPPPPRHGCVGA